MGFPQALSETRAIQAEVPTNLVGNHSHSLCWKAFPQSLSEKYTIHNLATRPSLVEVPWSLEESQIGYSLHRH